MNFDLLLGRNLGQKIIIFLTVGLYIYLFFMRPSDAKESFSNGLSTFISLFTLILAAILLASAIEVLIPTSLVQQFLGIETGLKGVLTGGVIGGFLQGGPFAAYPIIKTLYDEGASLAAILTMLIGYSAIGTGRIPYGLAFFESKIVALRVLAGLLLTIFAGTILYLLLS